MEYTILLAAKAEKADLIGLKEQLAIAMEAIGIRVLRVVDITPRQQRLDE